MNTLTPDSLLNSLACKPVAFAYSRFPSGKQADGDSKSRQERLFKAWPDAPNYEIIPLHDGGVSAYTGKNRTVGQFGLFLAQLRSGQLGAHPVLLIENLDRMSRQELETAQTLFLEIISFGATIVTLHNGKRYAKGMGLVDIITALLEMDLAHQHSAKLSMRVKAAAAARKAAGKVIHNRASAPGWLSLEDKRTRFVPIPERVAIVKQMFDLAAKGVGPDGIARLLNIEKVPTWSTRKNGLRVWRGEHIASIIHGRAVLGEFEGRAGYFGDGVIPVELWAQVNERARKEAQGRGKGIVTEKNLLCGLLISGIDGTKMILRMSGARDRKSGEYVWHHYLVSNATVAGLSKHRAKYDAVEQRLLWLFKNIDPGAMARARTGVRDDTADRVASLSQEVKETKRQIDKYNGLIEKDDAPSPTLVAALKRYESEHKAAKDALAAAQVQAQKAQAVPEAEDTDLTKPENRRALRAEIARWCEKITLHTEHMIVWFSEKTGLRVPLLGPFTATDVNLENAEEGYEEQNEPNSPIDTAA